MANPGSGGCKGQTRPIPAPSKVLYHFSFDFSHSSDVTRNDGMDDGCGGD
jgi:hypothetical protein